MTRARPSLAVALVLVLLAGAFSSLMPVECCTPAAEPCCPGDPDATGQDGTPPQGSDEPCTTCECCAVLRVAPPPVLPIVAFTLDGRRIETRPAIAIASPATRDVFHPPKLRQV